MMVTVRVCVCRACAGTCYGSRLQHAGDCSAGQRNLPLHCCQPECVRACRLLQAAAACLLSSLEPEFCQAAHWLQVVLSKLTADHLLMYMHVSAYVHVSAMFLVFLRMHVH